MDTNGNMDFGSRTIWIACSNAVGNELRHDSDFQMDGKRFDETNQRKSFKDRANNYQANR